MTRDNIILLVKQTLAEYAEIDIDTDVATLNCNDFDNIASNIANKLATSRMLFICDQRACETCHDRCMYTATVKHARNFFLDKQGNYVEKPKPDCNYATDNK